MCVSIAVVVSVSAEQTKNKTNKNAIFVSYVCDNHKCHFTLQVEGYKQSTQAMIVYILNML